MQRRIQQTYSVYFTVVIATTRTNGDNTANTGGVKLYIVATIPAALAGLSKIKTDKGNMTFKSQVTLSAVQAQALQAAPGEISATPYEAPLVPKRPGLFFVACWIQPARARKQITS